MVVPAPHRFSHFTAMAVLPMCVTTTVIKLSDDTVLIPLMKEGLELKIHLVSVSKVVWQSNQEWQSGTLKTNKIISGATQDP